MIGSYSWSFSTKGPSTSKSGDTHCSGCVVNVSDVTITTSLAVSKSVGEMWAGLHALQCSRCVHNFACVLRWLLH